MASSDVEAAAASGNGKQTVDAGAATVVESKGTWWQAGFHMTTATLGPASLSLRYALRGLGWALGLAALTAVAAVTFYAYFLVSPCSTTARPPAAATSASEISPPTSSH
ncbi:unnamed protein product [Urochloa humidicola]